ncbi:hypothetical protein HPB52_011189 [Rhipicephalus sanguineus]|uniref:Uncharacterized protein n=1 Tax=Rhipicephalus sanguineus TaxID=34632 RepID=A0A9D4T9I4_RHISA|nr:hypothetical protein HPB52_011189 [Rhipicephalus sanguineus]
MSDPQRQTMGDSAQCDERPIIQDGGMSSYERNLYLYHAKLDVLALGGNARPSKGGYIAQQPANYEVAIPSVAGEEAQAAPRGDGATRKVL